ncbi:aromatic amino acid ammonia-lyase [Cloacibacillus sp. An23]|uniref:HAL/PAL/TAL family ammonia-lyase n=1 Tax=Cloacibacillus sp. An23 TaxID=1965591 RepID=UPI000B38EE31|nr:aromatic amino acid ammonia-lyase [Cloacibacillus sp. An23]OUO93527.1 hypothetical protein B5F39_07475 [Cloacibacillus sp. An23]
MEHTLTNIPKVGWADTIQSVTLGTKSLSLEEFVAVARYNAKLTLSQEYLERVFQSRALVEKFLDENRAIYGLTTGFGDNVRTVIPQEEAVHLQINILRSHAASVGKPMSPECVRATWLMQLLSLGRGVSGIRPQMLSLIVSCLNANIIPYAPGEGSIQSLSVEANINLVLIGEGQAWYNGELLPGAAALNKAGLKPLAPACKEGLCLTNGINGATGITLIALYDSMVGAQTADIAAAMAYEALRGTIKGCDARLHALKHHSEQQGSAENIRNILADSRIMAKYMDSRVQDPYILRSIPQVHGAAKRFLKDAATSLIREMASCNDNPIVWPNGNGDGEGLMGANFDGTYVGAYADTICIADANLGKFSERRTDRLTNRHFSGGYPPFLADNPGVNNCYMIVQYTAAGLVSEIRNLCIPATGDSIPVSANWEDPIPMAWWAAIKSKAVSEKLEYLIAIEIMVHTRAFDLTDTKVHGTFASATIDVHDLVRSKVPYITGDRYFGSDIETTYQMVKSGEVLKTVEKRVGKLIF